MSIKRRILAILLVVVMLLSVSGCSLLFGVIRGIDGQIPNGVTDNRDKIVAFSELEYERPDIDEISDLADDVRKLVDKGKVNDKLIGAYEEFYDAYTHYITMSNLALIRSNLDTSDEYYADEDAWCSSQSGEVERILDDLLRYCAKSDIADELDEEYFDGYLAENYGDDSIGEYTDEIVELYEQESELQTRYYELSTEMSEVSIRDTDKWDEFNAEAAELYIDLIKVHRQLADEFGYESYYEMAYEDFGRDYSAEDTEDYVNAIKKYMVPLYKAAIEDGSLYDRYDIGTMRPQRSFKTVKNCVSDMNDTLAEIMEFMSEYEMYDVSSSSDKFEGSYTTYLFQKGLDKILKKVGEESTEVIIAGKAEDKAETIYEIADLAYHVLVLMVQMGISVEDIRAELASRHIIDHKVKQEKMTKKRMEKIVDIYGICSF